MSTTIVDRYVKHPAPASGPLADGDPFDAGTAHIVHHDVTWLQRRNVRLVAHAVGPGDILLDDDAWVGHSTWADVADVTEPTDSDAWSAIPWARERCGWVCGPIALAHTRLSASPPGFHPRKLKVIVQCDKSADAGTTLSVLAALTSTPDPPTVGRRLAVTQDSVTDADAGAWTFSLTLTASEVVVPDALWTSRGDVSESAQTRLAPAWVWVGWTTDTFPNPDRIDSISVFEVWE
ncbi:MAG TPA: hypothetical protein VFV33_13155 [Gemmatimonadaceae bacterium]|nr:hypothetical protein [Gemmatimonadaceae bacterium]